MSNLPPAVRLAGIAVTAVFAMTLALPALAAPPAGNSAGPAGDTAADGTAVALSAGCPWRKHYTFMPPRLSVAAAAEAGIEADAASRAKALAGHYRGGLSTPPPPADWRGAGFDDSDWLVGSGGEFATGDSRMGAGANLTYARGTDGFVPEVGLVCARGKFQVAEPGEVRSLTLQLAYRGGFVAWLNGKEVARGHLPAGEIAADTPAAEVPLDAFLAPPDAKGNRVPLHWWYHQDAQSVPLWAKRERSAGPVRIDPSLLRRGVNVLAIEHHRSDYPAACRDKKTGLCFATVGLSTLRLTADAPAGCVRSGTDRPAGLQVWTRPAWEAVHETSYADPAEGLSPVRIAAARNGEFSGQVVVGSTAPIRALSVKAGALRADGGAEIAPSAVTVRYGSVNPVQAGRSGWRLDGLGGRRFDRLMDAPAEAVDPAAVANPSRLIRGAMGLPPAATPGAVVPVYVTVRVPKTASPGRYRGSLTVSGAGAEAVSVPVELTVADWTLSEVADYVSLVNVYQSPDTLARYYELDLWSDRHGAMIDRSMALMGRIGNIGLFLPLLAESQFGNAESMVVWLRRPDGTYDYDFSAFDRYLEAALKYHTRLKFVAVCAWGYECRTDRGKGAKVTVRDGASGGKSTLDLPACGTAECEKLLGPLLKAVRDRLAQRGLDKRMLLGLPADGGPDWQTVAMFRRILPEVRWIRESHFNAASYRYDPQDRAKTVPVAYNSIVWGGEVPDPAARRLYGWRYNGEHLIMTFNRAGASALNLHGFASPWAFRIWMSSTLAGGRNGNGRVGGDYWRIGMRPRGGGRISSEAEGGCGGTLYGSYLASAVGQVGLGNSTSDLFAPGPDGPVTTQRFENAIEGNQQTEARIAIERALLDKEHPLPAELAGRCQVLLDRRTNAIRMEPLGRSLGRQGWRESTRRLYEVAGEVVKANAR